MLPLRGPAALTGCVRPLAFLLALPPPEAALVVPVGRMAGLRNGGRRRRSGGGGKPALARVPPMSDPLPTTSHGSPCWVTVDSPKYDGWTSLPDGHAGARWAGLPPFPLSPDSPRSRHRAGLAKAAEPKT
ncbi:hypothetical protein B0T11DRAFT_322520 [Plectosphaerella cucumerina]|uniref:Secreted protein n=1 Tax=Plectosphaerella cucumerina TaxID=40658 RepID=A0A8K0T9E6_9PEZI|nr:hypothetical protein B0T11DRAFT_322520 [Plectosphaerella cucumerina]